MKTAIIYATRSGTAEKCSAKISEMLSGESTVVNIKKVSSPDLSGYDSVIVGASIRIGKVQKEISEFVQKNLETLKAKRLGVFLCMGAGEENFNEYLSQNFPKEFLDKCKAKGFFGGEFNLERLGFLSKMMLKAASKGKPQPHIIPGNIDRFVKDFED
ncbi:MULTISPECIES: flavodoxin domain-containing protein [unclassified Mesotoga]|uniref:flavodoxin domain-containing protein n=2 Tax=Mesotoga TaxID=1184396 RepID=UPI000EF212E1|nr:MULTISPECIES: flavodoxin domain-containing protein [unclassified Mesotoga]MDD4207488.1 flavodoxin domain-containing protein [Mesotoga sp.]MDI9367691.1 flavodoxin domain-containing protein [Thermotogota bacterium]NLT45942.1 flavodoxin [Thermotogaceae bacterium]RLL86477.1 flavodoxin [Mesotoga sp. BH458_6_3_2_1]